MKGIKVKLILEVQDGEEYKFEGMLAGDFEFHSHPNADRLIVTLHPSGDNNTEARRMSMDMCFSEKDGGGSAVN